MPPGRSGGYAIVDLDDVLAFSYAIVEDDQARK
jgi:hypothetical protein